MKLLTFDLGGTSVKYGIWEAGVLSQLGSFPTPKTWSKMQHELMGVYKKLDPQKSIDGVSFSAPGSVDTKSGIIEGISAIPYIHHFHIQQDLQDLFDKPVSLENDANCAALAEVWQGNAQTHQEVAFVVLGTGVGGSLVKDKILQKGAHLFGGEFGYMYLTPQNTFSELGSPVNMATRYNQNTNRHLTGQEVFERADQGEIEAQKAVNEMYDYIAQGLYNIQLAFDPHCIVLGGAMSQRHDLQESLLQRLKQYAQKAGIQDFPFDLRICKYYNDANLIGSVYAFKQLYDK